MESRITVKRECSPNIAQVCATLFPYFSLRMVTDT